MRYSALETPYWDDEDRAGRLTAIRRCLVDFYAAYNVTAHEEMIDRRAGNLVETLCALRGDRIVEFFTFVRNEFKRMPSDSEMKGAISADPSRWTRVAGGEQRLAPLTQAELDGISERHPDFSDLLDSVNVRSDELPDEEWKREFFGRLNRYLTTRRNSPAVVAERRQAGNKSFVKLVA